MELALSLGETPKPFSFIHKSHMNMMLKKTDLGFCMVSTTEEKERSQESENRRDQIEEMRKGGIWSTNSESDHHHHPVQLDLLPSSPVPRNHHPSSSPADQLPFSWLTHNLISEPGSVTGPGKGSSMNRKLLALEETEEGAALSSPNSGASSFQMEYSLYRSGRSNKRDFEGIGNEVEIERAASSRGSDDEDINGLTRKKLRLTKDQSAFLEESFKEHNTLNPKQKQALAKQLNLRPRQVEVWFQNRRARTKLKQTEVDCEYLKRCCETLTEENKRLQKELNELRALKSSQPFYMHLPATTLTMCPSCERVATTATTTTTTAAAIVTTATTTTATNTTMSLAATPRLHPFLRAQVNAPQASS